MSEENSKWKSRRWMITVWAMALSSLICVFGIVFHENAYVPVATSLVAVPVAFTSLESLNKKYRIQKKEKEE